MAGNTATVGLTGIVLAAVGLVGYLADVFGGRVAIVLVVAGAVLNVVWFLGVLVEGARSERRRP